MEWWKQRTIAHKEWKSILIKYVNKDRFFTKAHLTHTLFMWNGGNRGQFRTRSGRSILMKYVKKDCYFTKSHIKRTLFMWNGGNGGQFAQRVEGRLCWNMWIRIRTLPNHVPSVELWDRGQVRITSPRSICIQYVNRDNYFTKSLLNRPIWFCAIPRYCLYFLLSFGKLLAHQPPNALTYVVVFGWGTWV